MHYSLKMREQKVKELENNKEFISFAQDHYEECRKTGRYENETFEKYLVSEVFNLYDNFTMIQFLQTADKQTINRILEEALKGI